MEFSNVDEFDVGQVLGRGGFGMVHRARHRATGLDVAVKIIDKQQMRASGMTERVVNEVTLHSALRHPSIVELLGYFEDSHYVYLVMELCCRGDLYRYLRKQGSLEEGEAARFLVQVLSALAYLHGQHIVHRDLKLSNLLLTRDMRVKISDFGLAVRLQSPDEEHYTICGTPNYIAPEMASQGPHGLPADLWSMGCLFYTLVAGKAPFQGEETSETLEKASKGRYSMPPGLSDHAVDFLQSLLQTDPGHRTSITSVLSHPFILQFCDTSVEADLPCPPITIPSPYYHHQGSIKQQPPHQSSSAPLTCTAPPTPYNGPASTTTTTNNKHEHGGCLSSTFTASPSSVSPCSLSFRSPPSVATHTVQAMDPLEPLSTHTAALSSPPPPPPPAAAASSAWLQRQQPHHHHHIQQQQQQQQISATAIQRDAADYPPQQPHRHHQHHHHSAAPQQAPPTIATSPVPPPSTSPRRQPRQASSSSLPPSPHARKRPLPPPPPMPKEKGGIEDAGLPPPPLLMPINTSGLGPFHFPLPGSSSLRCHRDGHLTLRLPTSSCTLRIFKQGLRVSIWTTTTTKSQHSPPPRQAHQAAEGRGRGIGDQSRTDDVVGGGGGGGKPETYSLMELPPRWRPVYAYAARLVESIRSRMPKVTLFVLRGGGRRRRNSTGDHHSHYYHHHVTATVVRQQEAPLRQPVGGGEGEAAALAKCMLMENGPLPDFLVRWVDGTYLNYQLRTGALQLRLTVPPKGTGGSSGDAPIIYRWSLRDSSGDGSGHHHGWSSICGSEAINKYLRVAQQAMLRCLELDPSSSSSSSLPRPMVKKVNGEVVGGDGGGGDAPSSSLVYYEYVEDLEAGDPLVEVMCLSSRGNERLANTMTGGGRGVRTNEEEEEKEERKEKVARGPDGGAAVSANPWPVLQQQQLGEQVDGNASPLPAGAGRVGPVVGDDGSSSGSRRRRSRMMRQEGGSGSGRSSPGEEGKGGGGGALTHPPIAATATAPSSTEAKTGGAVVVKVEGVGSGWRDGVGGDLVVAFDDGARMRLDQNAQAVHYTPPSPPQAEAGNDGERQALIMKEVVGEEEETYLLPGSTGSSSAGGGGGGAVPRVKIPRAIRDRMKHLSTFIRLIQAKQEEAGKRGGRGSAATVVG